MARVIVKNGAVAVSGGRVVTDAGGAPCCCGPGEGDCPANLINNRFRLDLRRLIFSATLGDSRDLSITSEINLRFPPAIIDFNNEPDTGQAPYQRLWSNAADTRLPATVGADCGRQDDGNPSYFNFTPCGQFVDIISTQGPPGGDPIVTTQTRNITGLKAMGINTQRVVAPDESESLVMLGMQFLFHTCFEDRFGQLFYRDKYLELFFEESDGPAGDLQVVRWGTIPVRGTVPLECGELRVTESDLSGRRYIPTGSLLDNDAQMIVATEIYETEDATISGAVPNIGNNTHAVLPNGYESTGGVTGQHTVALDFRGFILDSRLSTGDPSLCVDDPFVEECTDGGEPCPPVDPDAGTGDIFADANPSDGGTDAGGPTDQSAFLLGDAVERAIKTITLNQLATCPACQRRKEVLNQFGLTVGRAVLRRLGW
jgi:hypothetical protein